MPRIPYWPDKDADDVATYRIDWAARLAGNTISTSVFSVVDGSTAIDTEANTTTTASVALSGGAEGETAEILNRITTSASEQFDQTMLLRVRKR